MANVYLFGSHRLDAAQRRLRTGGDHVTLTPKAANTLVALLERAGEVVEKKELIDAVWGEQFVEQGVLAQNIYLLRGALGRCGKALIATVPGRGYRFTGEVRRLSAGADRIKNLAILPFECLGFGHEGEVLGLAQADALVTELGGRSQLAVRPTAAVRSLLGQGCCDPLAIAAALQVDGVVTGTLHRVGERLRATVQLFNLDCEQPIWAERFDGEAGDLFTLQDTMAFALAGGLGEGRRRHRASAPATSDAYLHYARGRFFWNKRTARGLEQAIESFERAIAVDPGYAVAHAGLADCYSLLPLYGGRCPHESFPKATSAALEALALDDLLAPAHTSLAYARFLYHRDWQAARRGFERALRLDPNYPTAHHWLGFLCSALGRHQEAEAASRRAVELDPLSLVINSDLGLVLYAAGRSREAIEQFRRTLELDPSFAYAHFGAALAHAEAGDRQAALASARRAAELQPDNPAMAAVLGYALARAGRTQAALGQLAELERLAAVDAAPKALVLTALGETAAALDALEEALDDRSRFVAFLAVWPAWRPLRATARFERLLARLGGRPGLSQARLPKVFRGSLGR
jgi:DNA-binding winged helix-turn-helix (wHTH) protein/tetratricopeptide (TPR) repeat protein